MYCLCLRLPSPFTQLLSYAKLATLSPEQFQYWRGVYPAPTDWEGDRVPSERLNALQNPGRSVSVLSVAWSRRRGRNPAPLPGPCPLMLSLLPEG